MKILITHPYGIGDVLFCRPLIETLRRLHPESVIGFVGNRRTESLVRTWPEIGWQAVFEKDDFRSAWRRSRPRGAAKLRKLIRAVRAERFDVQIDLSLGWHYGLAGRLAGIPKRAGFDYRNRGRFLTHRLPLDGFETQPVAESILDLLPLLGWERPNKAQIRMDLPSDAQAEAGHCLAQAGISPSEPLIGLVPGGGDSWGPNARFKRWPPDRFARLADKVVRQGREHVILLGDPAEARLGQAVIAGMRNGRGQWLQTPNLSALAGVLKRCRLVIGNDSGPMHLAAALGVPTVSIFGPVDPSVYGPTGDPNRHRVAVRGLACQPCYRKFRFPPCPWENRCLRDLPVARVWETARRALPE